MPRLAVNGIELEMLLEGPAEAPPLLLIMGLGVPLTRWPRALCEALLQQGFRLIRFDNRDAGLSTHLDHAPVPNLGAALRGMPLEPAYTLDDMAADCVGLLDALAIPRAHIAGASMGGAIAQIVAARYPQRVLSLTSIMSSSGHPSLPPPTPAAAAALFAPLPRERQRDAIVADALQRYQAIASPAYPEDPQQLQAMFAAEYERSFDPRGVARQMAAILAHGDRRPLLAGIRAPTVVLHGAADPLIPPACGEDVAAHIPGAELRLVPGMGHDFPAALAPVIADAIAAAAARATLQS